MPQGAVPWSFSLRLHHDDTQRTTRPASAGCRWLELMEMDLLMMMGYLLRIVYNRH